MKSFVFSFYMACFVVVSVMACDLAIEYEKDGVCCKMCGPGTRVNSQPSCEDPVCTPCGKYEYQPSYTKENKCKQQPYCDPNMNFQVVDLNPKKEASCNCKAEHHCSSLECLTCVPNTVCSPGEGVYQKATRFNDTVCRACGEGTFSNESSTVEDCRKWTTCAEKTHKIKKSGTPTSDVVCEEVSDNSSIAVGLSIGFVLAIVTGLLTCFIKKEPEMLKRCFKKGKNPGNMDDKIVGPLIAPEVGNHYVLERAWPGNGVEQQQESLSLQVPEETDESFPQNAKTFNNKPLRQEEGKMELTSQPESDGTAEHIESTFN
ncbi:hypothetical protein COCON_G00146900 [Conger conger]|uniref:TNFR-Cys domain-containing protein n=1 Tax=Conger conger TaxID=82655 RepID=A0A9Q1DBW1_CONCO|nr:tumor necrosis factor receptor superfamily member 5 [Conger conger]KAJ8265591.1 hypothetical protein COCON_G00146900 [Conger conger]